MKLHTQGKTVGAFSAADTERLVLSLTFTERTLREAADLTFEEDVRRRVLRAANRLERAIDTVRGHPALEPSLLDINFEEPTTADVAV